MQSLHASPSPSVLFTRELDPNDEPKTVASGSAPASGSALFAGEDACLSEPCLKLVQAFRLLRFLDLNVAHSACGYATTAVSWLQLKRSL